MMGKYYSKSTSVIKLNPRAIKGIQGVLALWLPALLRAKYYYLRNRKKVQIRILYQKSNVITCDCKFFLNIFYVK